MFITYGIKYMEEPRVTFIYVTTLQDRLLTFPILSQSTFGLHKNDKSIKKWSIVESRCRHAVKRISILFAL